LLLSLVLPELLVHLRSGVRFWLRSSCSWSKSAHRIEHKFCSLSEFSFRIRVKDFRSAVLRACLFQMKRL
jgi:hypothetical protein